MRACQCRWIVPGVENLTSDDRAFCRFGHRPGGWTAGDSASPADQARSQSGQQPSRDRPARRCHHDQTGDVGEDAGQNQQECAKGDKPPVGNRRLRRLPLAHGNPHGFDGPHPLSADQHDTDRRGRQYPEEQRPPAQPLADQHEEGDLDRRVQHKCQAHRNGQSHREDLSSRSCLRDTQSPTGVTCHRASRTMAPLIFDAPSVRSTKVMGTSATRRPERTARQARST